MDLRTTVLIEQLQELRRAAASSNTSTSTSTTPRCGGQVRLLEDLTPFLDVFRGGQRGLALHRNDWLPEALSTQLFDYLVEHGPWHQDENVMFGKKVLQPRLKFQVGESYYYSGRVHSEADRDEDKPGVRLPFEEVKSVIRAVMDLVEDVVGHPINNAMIQLYRDGNDCIGAHSDDDSVMRYDVVHRGEGGGSSGGTPLAPDNGPSGYEQWRSLPCSVSILSLGAPRLMEFTASPNADGAKQYPLCVTLPKPKMDQATLHAKSKKSTSLSDKYVAKLPTHDGNGAKLGEAKRRLLTATLPPGQLVTFNGDQSLTMHAINRLGAKQKLTPSGAKLDKPRISISMRWFYRADEARPTAPLRFPPNNQHIDEIITYITEKEQSKISQRNVPTTGASAVVVVDVDTMVNDNSSSSAVVIVEDATKKNSGKKRKRGKQQEDTTSSSSSSAVALPRTSSSLKLKKSECASAAVHHVVDDDDTSSVEVIEG